MTDPKRLIDDELTSHFENSLIHAGRGEVLDAGHRSRLFSGLGLVALAPLSAAALADAGFAGSGTVGSGTVGSGTVGSGTVAGASSLSHLTGALQSGVQPLQAGAQSLAGGSLAGASAAGGGLAASAPSLASQSLAKVSLGKLAALKSAIGLKGLLAAAGLLSAAGLVGSFSNFDAASPSLVASQVAVTVPALTADPASLNVQDPLLERQSGLPGALAGSDDAVAANPVIDNAEAQLGSSLPKAVTSRRDTAEASSLTRELQLVDVARQALLRGEPRTTLTRLDAYRAQFPKGMLRSEALMLRVEALVALGDRASARRVADQLLRKTPNSPYSRRIHSLLGE